MEDTKTSSTNTPSSPTKGQLTPIPNSPRNNNVTNTKAFRSEFKNLNTVRPSTSPTNLVRTNPTPNNQVQVPLQLKSQTKVDPAKLIQDIKNLSETHRISSTLEMGNEPDFVSEEIKAEIKPINKPKMPTKSEFKSYSEVKPPNATARVKPPKVVKTPIQEPKAIKEVKTPIQEVKDIKTSVQEAKEIKTSIQESKTTQEVKLQEAQLPKPTSPKPKRDRSPIRQPVNPRMTIVENVNETINQAVKKQNNEVKQVPLI